MSRTFSFRTSSIPHFLPFTFSSRYTAAGAEGYEHFNLTQTTPNAVPAQQNCEILQILRF